MLPDVGGRQMGIIYLTPHTHQIVGSDGPDLESEAVGAPEIEITPEMIAAGSEVIWRSFCDEMPWGSTSAHGVVTEVFRAMLRGARPADAKCCCRLPERDC